MTSKRLKNLQTQVGDCDDYSFGLKSILDAKGYETAVVAGDLKTGKLLDSMFSGIDHPGLEIEIDGEIFYGDVAHPETLYPQGETPEDWNTSTDRYLVKEDEIIEYQEDWNNLENF